MSKEIKQIEKAHNLLIILWFISFRFLTIEVGFTHFTGHEGP
jgi:hypothetical protein